MKIIGAVVLTSLVLLPVLWQPGMTASNDPKPERVVDASGSLRVPSDYRTAYQFLGSWAVAVDQGPGSMEIQGRAHVERLSTLYPGDISPAAARRIDLPRRQHLNAHDASAYHPAGRLWPDK
jgi:hypothetical protein